MDEVSYASDTILPQITDEVSYQTTSGLVKQRPQEFDDTVRDADEEIISNQFRGSSKNYIKLKTLVDYPSSIDYMNKNMPQYKPRHKRDLNEVRKEYYNCS